MLVGRVFTVAPIFIRHLTHLVSEFLYLFLEFGDVCLVFLRVLCEKRDAFGKVAQQFPQFSGRLPLRRLHYLVDFRHDGACPRL